MAKAGKGVRTRQYNPRVELVQLKTSSGRPIRKATKVIFEDGRSVQFLDRFTSRSKAIAQARAELKKNPGATNLAQYTMAAVEHTRGAHDAGGKVIHETPKAKRREFAREIWFRRGYRNPRRNSVASTILEQLGGRRFSTMTGAKNFVSDGNSLRFKLPANFAKRGINLVRVTLDQSDTYTIEFFKMHGTNVHSIAKRSGVYADDLQRVFKSETGLDTSLGSMGRNPGRPFIGPGGKVFVSGSRRKIPYRGFTLKRSGSLWRVFYPDGREFTQRFTEEKAYSAIDDTIRRQGLPNPDGGAAADAAYKVFHGRGPDRKKHYDVASIDPYNDHPDLWQLGQLKSLTVGEFIQGFNGREGDQPHSKDPNAWAVTLEFDNNAPDLAGEPGGRQLFIVGGDQNAGRYLSAMRVDPGKETVDCGNVYRIEYFTRKGFDKFAPVNYWHHFGEETGVQPRLIYDRTNHRLQLAGGEYVVKREGIVN